MPASPNAPNATPNVATSDVPNMLPNHRHTPGANILRALSPWFTGLIVILLLLPIGSVVLSWLETDQGAMAHIAATTLPDLLQNTLLLTVFVGIGTTIIGTLTAWLTAHFDWRGRRLLEWMLVLPLAMPAYVLAYAYTDLLQYAGPIQTWLRDVCGWQSKSDYWFFDIRSLGGAALMLVCALYPYVYLLSRVAFLEQSASLFEAGRTFGDRRSTMFFRVSLPLARPAIVAGMALTMMETLADYGTVSYFGVNTFTSGIFNAWFSQGDRIAAAKLATMLLVFVALIMMVEHLARHGARFADNASRKPRREVLHGVSGWLALLICAIPVLSGFMLPLLLLIRLAYQESGGTWIAVATKLSPLIPLATNSLLLATITALIAVALALWLAYQQRRSPSLLSRTAHRAVGLGYAVPGTVIAVGVLIPITRLDHQLADLLSSLAGRDVGLLLTGGISVLVYAYLIRFLAISLQACDAGFAKITPSIDQAARSLGANSVEVICRVHLPMLRASLMTAGLMVFVDVMKELPATIVMRPFNFDTLAVRTYTLAKDERLGEASFVALAIVFVGLIPVVFASRAITKSTEAQSH